MTDAEAGTVVNKDKYWLLWNDTNKQHILQHKDRIRVSAGKDIESCNIISKSEKYKNKERYYHQLMMRVDHSRPYPNGEQLSLPLWDPRCFKTTKNSWRCARKDFLMQYDQEKRIDGAIKLQWCLKKTKKTKEMKTKTLTMKRWVNGWKTRCAGDSRGGQAQEVR